MDVGSPSLAGYGWQKTLRYDKMAEQKNNELDRSACIRMGALLLLGTVLYFFTNIQRVAIPGSVFNELQTGLSLSAAQVTSFGAAFMYIYAISQLFVGILTDSIGGVRVLTIGAILFGIGSVMFPLAPNLTLLYISRGLVGFGASMFYVSLVQTASRAFPKQFTVLMGILLLCGCIGGIAANSPFVACVHLMGWKQTLLIAGIITACTGILVVLTGLTLPKTERQKIRFDLGTFPRVLKNRSNVMAYLSLGICFGIYYVIHTAFGMKFLEDFCQMDSTKAAAILSGMGLMSAASSFLCVYTCRLIRGRCKPFFMLAAIMTTLTTLLISIFVFFEIRTSVIIALFWILSFVCNFGPINLTLLRDINQPEHLGTAVSCGNGFNYLMVAVLGSISGFFMDLFPPVVKDGITVYGKMSYFSLYLFLFLLSLFALYSSIKLPEVEKKSESEGK